MNNSTYPHKRGSRWLLFACLFLLLASHFSRATAFGAEHFNGIVSTSAGYMSHGDNSAESYDSPPTTCSSPITLSELQVNQRVSNSACLVSTLPLPTNSIFIAATGGSPSTSGYYYVWEKSTGLLDLFGNPIWAPQPSLSGYAVSGQLHIDIPDGEYRVTISNSASDLSCTHVEVIDVLSDPSGTCSGLNIIQYFIEGPDPGFDPSSAEWKTFQLPATATLNMFESISDGISTLSPGTYLLHVRVAERDEATGERIWSPIASQRFYVQDPTSNDPPQPNHFVEAEWFVSDPEEGPGIYLQRGQTVMVPNTEEIDVHRLVDMSALTAGTYTFSIRIKDLLGRWTFPKSASFTVDGSTSCALPQVAFTVDQDDQVAPGVEAGEQVVFLNASTNTAPGATYQWDFEGDGSIDATGPNASHAYSNAGVYHAILIVTQPNGCSNAFSRAITVHNGSFYTPPTNTISPAGPIDLCHGAPLQTLTAPSGSTNWIWSNGASTSSIDVSAGQYRVSYTDALGVRHTTPNVQVNRSVPITASFDVFPETNGDGNGSIRINWIDGPDGRVNGTGSSGPYSVSFESLFIGSWTSYVRGADQMWLMQDLSDPFRPNISANDYRITITASNGCSWQTIVTLHNETNPNDPYIVRAQYWFDDYNGVPLDLDPSNELLHWAMAEYDASLADYINKRFFRGQDISGSFEIPTSGYDPATHDDYNLDPGVHTLHLRVKTAIPSPGGPAPWSFTIGKTFYVQAPAAPVTPSPNLEFAEVFRVDGTGTTYAVTPQYHPTPPTPPVPVRETDQPHRGFELSGALSVPVIDGELLLSDSDLSAMGLDAGTGPYTLGVRMGQKSSLSAATEWSHVQFVQVDRVEDCNPSLTVDPVVHTYVNQIADVRTTLEVCTGDDVDLEVFNVSISGVAGSIHPNEVIWELPDGSLVTGQPNLQLSNIQSAQAGEYKAYANAYASGGLMRCASAVVSRTIVVRPSVPASLGPISSTIPPSLCSWIATGRITVSADPLIDATNLSAFQWSSSNSSIAVIPVVGDGWTSRLNLSNWDGMPTQVQLQVTYPCGQNLLSQPIELDVCNEDPILLTMLPNILSANRALLNGYLVDNGTRTPWTGWGFEYALDPGFTVNARTTPINPRSSSGFISSTVSDLQPNTNYYVRAFGISGNPFQVVTGQTEWFNTTQECHDRGLLLTNQLNYRVLVSWDHNSTASNYKIWWREQGEEAWLSVSSSSNSRLLELAPGDYEIFVSENGIENPSCIETVTVQCEDFGYSVNVFQIVDATKGKINVFGVNGGRRTWDFGLDNGTSTTWANNRFSNRFIQLDPGTYNVLVKDNYDCYSSQVELVTINPTNTSAIPVLNSVQNLGGGSMTLNWSLPNTSLVNAYQIRVKDVTGGGLGVLHNTYAVGGGSTTQFNVTGLLPGRYRFDLRARPIGGTFADGVYSNFMERVVSATSKSTSLNNEEFERPELIVYPNPTQDMLYVQAPQGSQLELLDLNGKRIAQRRTKATEEVFDLRELAQGVYILQISSDGAVHRERVVKQ